MTKTCTECGQTKPVDAFYTTSGAKVNKDGRQPACKVCRRAYAVALKAARPGYFRDASRRYREAHPDRMRVRYDLLNERRRGDSALHRRTNLRKFGMTTDDFDMLLARQGGRCAICLTDKPGGRGAFHVDHDHRCCPGHRSCGRCVRGLLCHGCNVGIGSLKEDASVLRRAIDYLGGIPEVKDGMNKLGSDRRAT